MNTSPATPGLDVYDIAFLAGGPERVVDAALVALVQSGRVSVHTPGRLATTDLTRRHPVEAAVLDAIGPVGHRSVDTIRWRLTGDDRLLDVARRLRGEGLVDRMSSYLRPRRGGRGGLAPNRSGHRVLREFRAAPPEDLVAGHTDALVVALAGRDHLPDRALAVAIFETPRTTSHLRRGSRSRDDREAAAEARQDVARTATVIHGHGGDVYFPPTGPTAAGVRPPRRVSRRERSTR
jgi:hypothetical protein